MVNETVKTRNYPKVWGQLPTLELFSMSMFDNVINPVCKFSILKIVNPWSYPVFEVTSWSENHLVVIFEISMFNNIINPVYEFSIIKIVNPRSYPVFEVTSWPENHLNVIFEISMFNDIINLVYKFFLLKNRYTSKLHGIWGQQLTWETISCHFLNQHVW